MRLQVFLSHNGVCSRRKAMDFIQQGRVKLNGQVHKEPSTPVDPQKDKIEVDGKPVASQKYSYILLNKPKDYVTTKAEFKGEKSVLELLPKSLQHLVPAGRLDKDTEGLLLLTNDGDLAYRLTHPKFNVEKTYFVSVYGMLVPAERRKLESGILIDGEKTSPVKIKDIKPLKDRTKTDFLLVMHEGKKRQIRLMCEAVGRKVAYLKRVAQGPLVLGNLQTGKWRELTRDELDQLQKIK